MDEPESCLGAGGIVGIVIGTFFVTCLLVVAAGLLYRQWRRNKGRHLVLVTDPEIVEEAYAFDNPCFKDSATPAVGRSLERQVASHNEVHHQHHHHHSSTPKDGPRWSTPWANLGKHEKRRTLDDSCLGPKAAARVSVVGLRSRDFTGLGFNVCGNMREGIFVKDLLHRGPASESGRIHPGDRISSVKISFRSMVYEDALTILSYASPYDVELEVESGTGTISKPSTLLKKSVGPSPTHICHPLYRSQSIPDLSNSSRKNVTSKRLFAAEPSNDSSYSNYSTMNSTLKSTKSTPGSQTLERRHEEIKANHHHHQSQHPKFGIKVLPALDGTVHRVENQNEHNTNLERRHSKKLEVVGMDSKRQSSNGSYLADQDDAANHKIPNNRVSENLQQRSAPVAGIKKVVNVTDGIDVPDRAAQIIKEDAKPAALVIPSEVPAEVHNAAMAARRNRKSSNMELADVQKIQQQVSDTAAPTQEANDAKSPQKSKRKAPAPPSRNASIESNGEEVKTPDEKTTLNGLSDHAGHDYRTSKDSKMEKSRVDEDSSIGDPEENEASKVDSKMLQERVKRINANNRRNSESDTDSELQNNSFTTIELNSSDITVHHTPVPDAAASKDDEEEDCYRKAASLGDLSKYNNANDPSKAAMLERAQSLDMTDSSGSKKRKAPIPPPEDIHESTEDLTKLGDSSSNRKLKKSSEWGTLEDAIWSGGATDAEEAPVKTRKKSSAGGSLERSKSNVEIKSTEPQPSELLSPEPLNVSDGAIETSLELYNLPLSKKLTQDFIRAERLFDPEEDNALARLVNDGRVLKSPTAEQIDEDFRRDHPLPDDVDDEPEEKVLEMELEVVESPDAADDGFEKAVRYFDLATRKDAPNLEAETKVQLPEPPEELYAGKKEVVEEPASKVRLDFGCPGCDQPHGRHSDSCAKRGAKEPVSYLQTIRVEDGFETHFAKPAILNLVDSGKSDEDDDEDNGKTLQQQRNVSNVSVSSGENSEDSGLAVRSTPRKMTYVTEIQVSPVSRDGDASSDNEEIVSILEKGVSRALRESSDAASSSAVTMNVTSNGKLPAGKKPPVPPRRSDVAKQVVYVSEYKSPEKNNRVADGKFENWVFLKDAAVSDREKTTAQQQQQEINPWGNGSSPSQPVTSIVLSSSNSRAADEKGVRK